MANGESQTTPAGDGDDQLVEKINENSSKKSNEPKDVFDDESGIISFVKSIYPGVEGDNSANLRSRLLKDEDLLDKVSNKILENSAKGNKQLQGQYEQETSLYNEHKQAVKDKIETALSQDVMKGETTRQSVVNRTRDLKTSDLSSLKRPKYAKTEYDSVINKEAKKHGLDPRLVKSVIQQESGFDPKAKSSAGAVGLMQLMPETAKELGVDPTDPEENIKGGVEYLAKQVSNADSLELALSAYNAGPNNEAALKGEIPKNQETQGYVKKVTGNYQELLKPSMNFDLPISEYRGIALENPEKYQELGLVTEEGEFKYDTEEGKKTLMNKLLNNEEMHKELIGDRYDQFLGKLENSNNTGAVDETNPDDMARAWAVYDKFGSEGLTHFLNVNQHYKKGQPIEEQDKSVQDAIGFMRNSDQGGFTVQNYIGTFFGREDSPVGKFEVSPVTRSAELEGDPPPKDLNNFTKYFNYEGNEGQGFQSFLGELKNLKQEEQSENQGFLGRVWGALTGDYIEGRSQTLNDNPNILEAIGGVTGQTMTITPKRQRFEGTPEEQVYEELVNGVDTSVSRGAKLEILREAEKEGGAFGVRDLIKTLMANSNDHMESDDGTTFYKINPDEASDRTKIAINTLRSEERYRNMFHTANDGDLLFEPQYYERISRDENIRAHVSQDWEKKAVTDNNGEVIGYAESPGEQDLGESITQVLGNVGHSFNGMLDEFVAKPAADILFSSIDNAQEIIGEDFFNEQEINLKQNYEREWREHFDAPLMQQMNFDDIGDIGSATALIGVPFGTMIAAMGKMGKAGVKAPWNYVKQMSKARGTTTKDAAAMVLGRGPGSTKMAARFKKMHLDAQKKRGVTNRLLKYSVGGVPIETMAGERWSPLGMGLADSGIEWGLNKIGVEAETDIEQTYKKSGRLTQIGMDLLGYETMGLLLDNAFAATKFGTSQFGRALGKKSFRGVEFDYGAGEFEKVAKPMFASDTRRTLHNMNNGLQDMPLGNMGESMANRFTGRAFMQDPTNKETLSDVATGFAEDAHPIMSEAKRIISDAVDYYDEKLGGAIRLSDSQKRQRVDQIHQDFMRNTAKKIKSGVEKTGGGSETPLKLARLLEQNSPSVKGTVPKMMDDGTPRHLMPMSDAQELSSQSNRYFVKPAQNSNFARVYEVDDGIWTSALSDELRNIYRGADQEEMVSRLFDRAGVGRGIDQPSQSQQQTRAAIETNFRKVYGEEVELPDGNRGVIIDADEDGFVVERRNGEIRRGVDIEEFSEEREVLANGRSEYTPENFENVRSAEETVEPAQPTGQTIDNVGDYLSDRLARLYPNLNERGQALIKAADQGDLPSNTTEELHNIAKENGVKASIQDSPEDIAARLKEKGQGRLIKRIVKKALDANDKAVRFAKSGADKDIPANQGDNIFQKSGLGESFMKSINSFANYAKENSSTARTMAKLLGVDNTDGYMKFGKNQTPITRFDPDKIGEDGLKTNFIFKSNDNGMDEYFINVRSINSEDAPGVWIRNDAGNLVFNPKWRRIEPNITRESDGSLPLYKPVERNGETWYRKAQTGEKGVFINVQKPTKNNRMTLKDVQRTGVDAVERNIEGETHYRLINEQQQAINPKLIKEHPTKVYNATSKVTNPPSAAKQAGREEAEEAVETQIEEAGAGRAVAQGAAGMIADNIFGTTIESPNGEDTNIGLFTIAGTAMGSKYIRNTFKQTYAGFLKKPVKNLFDKDYSTLFRTEKDIKKTKEASHMGMLHDPRNKYDQGTWNTMKNLWDSAKEVRRNTFESVRNSEYAMSSLMKIKHLDIEEADGFLRALETMNETINDISSSAPRRFASAIQELNNAGRLSDELAERLDSADPFQTFVKEIGPERVRELSPQPAERFTRQQAEEHFNLAFWRLKNSGAELEDGELVMDTPSNVQRMYDDDSVQGAGGMTKGEEFRQLDERLMDDPVFREFLESHRNFYNKTMNRWMIQMNKRIDQTFASLAPETQNHFREFLDSNRSYKQWFDSLSNRKQNIVRGLKNNNDNVADMVGYHNTKQKFNDLSGRYYPQMPSESKTERAFRQFVAREGISGKPKDIKRERFNEHMGDVMYRLNNTESERRFLQKYNKNSQQVEKMNFNSKSEAESKLSNISSHLRAVEDQQDNARFMERNKDRFIKTNERQVRENGELVLEEDGSVKTVTEYQIKVPEDMDQNIFDLHTGGFSANRQEYRQFYSDIQNNAFIRQSNFLERPRVRHLPHEILETDINAVRRQYSSDVGKRIHNAENNMFDNKELRANYLSPVESKLRQVAEDPDYPEHITNSMQNMYNTMNNIIDKSGEQLKKEAKWRSAVDTFKNALMMRFGFGFGWYNTFEWAVVGPHLTSGSQVWDTTKLFTANKQALDNTEKLLRTREIVRKEIGTVDPDFERFGMVTDSDALNNLNNAFTKGANYISDFSFTKDLGGNMFGWDTRKWGMGRLATDSFMGSNYVSTSIVAQSALGEARHVAKALRQLKQLPEDATQTVRVDGKAWTREDAVRKLEMLGIPKDRQDGFLKRSQKFGDLVEEIRSGEELSMERFTKDFRSKATDTVDDMKKQRLDSHVQDVFKIMQRSTENFHGTNKMYRPDGWNSPMGKALSTYSTYPFNFSMQTVNRRVKQPISGWWEKYGDQLKGGKTVNSMKMMHNLKKGNTQALKNMGLSNEAIENIPVDAYRGILKHLGSTLGVSTAGFTTMDAVNDLLAYPINDATGQEQWNRLRRRNTLNPGAPEEDQMTWSDIDEDMGLDTFMNIAHYMIGTMARSSAFGRYGDAVERQGALSREGIMSLSPVTGIIDSGFKDVFDIAKQPMSSYPTALTNKSYEFLVNNSPVVGSNVFGELRKGVIEQLQFKRENNDEEPIRFIDESTGEELNMEDINTRLQ